VVLAGPAMPGFRRFSSLLPTLPWLRVLGVLDEGQKRDFFAGLDVFALPSRVESFGLVFLEAWANGLPNVAYRAGGAAEVIRDGVDGLLVRCGEVGALAEALARLVRDGTPRRRFGEAGRERVGREFRWADRLSRVRAACSDLVAAGVPC